MIQSVLKVINGLVRIRGATDGTLIGNNTDKLKVDGSGVTQPISAASLPLPSGAATETTLTKIPVAQASTTSGQSGTLIQGAVTTSSPTYTTGQTDPLSLTVSGALRTDSSATTQPISGTITANQGGTWNINNISGTVILPTGAATSANQTTEITALQILDDVPTAQNGALVKGVPIMGQLDDTSTTAATEDNASYVRITAQRALHTNLRNSTGTEIGTVASPINTTHSDVTPATQSITALDVSTAPFIGANGQVFYTGTPTTNSVATFALSSENTVSVQSTIIGTGGTLVVELSYDGGTFWIRPSVYQPGTQIYTNSYTSPFTGLVSVVSATHIRVRSTTSWTGTATIAVVRSVNNLDINLIGIVSTANSTSVALAANATFTGTAEDVTDYASITIQVFTDQASATGGFKPQYSVDATNWDDGDSYSIAITPAGNGKYFSFPPQARYFRMVYVNGATLQTTFRMQIIYRRASVKSSSHRIGDILDDENDSELVKANIIARNSAGSFVNLTASLNSELQIADVSNNGGVQSALTVGTSAVLANVSGTNLTNRKFLTLQNSSAVILYWGYTNAVTTSTGTPLYPTWERGFVVGPNTNVYVIAGTASNNARVTERA